MIEKQLLDTSNYPPTHPLYSLEYKARLGCVKDESGGGDPFAEWVLLRPKCYSMCTISNKQHKRAKGVQRCVVEKEISHDNYRNIFLSPTSVLDVSVHTFHTHLHQIFTLHQRKRALSFFDDKRAWTAVNKSVAYGHHSLSPCRTLSPL
jgi:hypothetical protein